MELKNIKKILAVVLLCIIFLAGCTKTTDSESLKKEVVPIEGFTNTEYNFETDNQYYFSEYSGVVSVNEGYYINYGGFLYYLDKKNMGNHPVCSNPTCAHNTEDCDAYLGVAEFLQYYDGYLYYVMYDYSNMDSTLYRKSLDGSVVEKIGILFRAQYTPDITIHRGYAYFAWDSKNESTLYRIKLEKNAIREKLFVYKEGFHQEIYRIKGYGDGVFFEASYYMNVDLNNSIFNLYYFDSNENAIKLVKEDTGGDYAVAEGKLYYFKEGGVNQYDISSKKESLFYSIDEMVYVSYDGNYLYFDNNFDPLQQKNHKIYVVDIKGVLIDTIHLPEGLCYYGDRDYLFQSMTMGYQVLDKKLLGTGKQEWTKFTIYTYDMLDD